MTIWFFGVVFLMVPIIANGALRARGDAKTPMMVMMLAAAVNAVLDPAFIYGFGPIPAMGLEGAAIATVIARVVGFVYIVFIFYRRGDVVRFGATSLAAFKASTQKIMSVGAPAAVTNAVGPVAVGLVTAVVAQYGAEGLAAYGIGARVDSLVLMAPMALGGALSPFIGQNWGAHLLGRVAEGVRSSVKFALWWGLGGCLVLMLSAPVVAGVFSDDAAVIEPLVLYFYSIPVGYAFIGVASVASSTFNAVDRAIRSTWLSLLRSLVLAVPGAYIGGQIAGLRGVFLGLVAAYVLSAFLGLRWLRTLLHPDGEISPEDGEPLSAEAAAALMKDPVQGASLGALLGPVLELEGFQVRQLRGDVVGFFVGRRELAHIHTYGRLDLALPVEIGENLVNRGVVDHHPGHDDNGWYVHRISTENELEETVWLLRLAHLLYDLSRRGAADPITQGELDVFTMSPACVDAMVKASDRWIAEPAAA